MITLHSVEQFFLEALRGDAWVRRWGIGLTFYTASLTMASLNPGIIQMQQ
jgi:hypothetical protein